MRRRQPAAKLDVQLSRRTFLRGAGVAMALPWLESLPVWGAEPTPRRRGPPPRPKRFAALFMGNGINPKHWWAKGAGAEMELGKTPRAAGAAQDQDQRHQRPVQQGRHRRRHSSRADRQHPLRRAADKGRGAARRHQHGPGARQPHRRGDRAAQHGAGLRAADHRLSRDEFLDGLQLAHLLAERRLRRCRWRSIRRWRSTACSRTAAASATRASSTACRTTPPTLSRQVSAADKAKLDEYLTSVREVEKRVERHARGQGQGRRERARTAASRVIAMKRPDNGLPEDIREHMRLMCDIVALAFPDRQDARRHAAAVPRHLRPVLSVPRRRKLPTISASHDDLSDDYERITRYYVSQFAYLVDKLDAMPEGEGTVLDNSCLHVHVEHVVGQQARQHARCPLLTAGGLGGTLETGRVLDYTRRRRREPQAVQPVPLADGSHGREARPVRRRHRASRWPLMRDGHISIRAGQRSVCHNSGRLGGAGRTRDRRRLGRRC